MVDCYAVKNPRMSVAHRTIQNTRNSIEKDQAYNTVTGSSRLKFLGQSLVLNKPSHRNNESFDGLESATVELEQYEYQMPARGPHNEDYEDMVKFDQ